jgi:hypothetical protein
MDTMEGWHWLSHDRRLRYGDGRVANDGETLTVVGDPAAIKLCKVGMHASPPRLTPDGKLP